MNRVVYTWKLPASGIDIEWRPLTVGEEIDLTGQYNNKNLIHMQGMAFIARRITRYGDKPKCEISELRDWDPIDYQAFIDEIEIRESQRRAMLRKGQAGASPLVDLEQVIIEAQACANRLSVALKAVLENAKTAELEQQKGAGPL